MISDGYAAYARYAQCWAHTRRQFIEAENDEPQAAAQAIGPIRQLYRLETEAAEKTLKTIRCASTD